MSEPSSQSAPSSQPAPKVQETAPCSRTAHCPPIVQESIYQPALNPPRASPPNPPRASLPKSGEIPSTARAVLRVTVVRGQRTRHRRAQLFQPMKLFLPMYVPTKFSPRSPLRPDSLPNSSLLDFFQPGSLLDPSHLGSFPDPHLGFFHPGSLPDSLPDPLPDSLPDFRAPSRTPELPRRSEAPHRLHFADREEPQRSIYSPVARAVRERYAPPSPYGLLEELFVDEPFHLLVCCVLLNQTRRVQVDRILFVLLAAFPSPATMAAADKTELAQLLKPLGLHRRRATSLRLLAAEFEKGAWEKPMELPGVGRYGQDAYDIFCLGRWVEAKPADHALSWYRQWACGEDPDPSAPLPPV
mmetsp:Transcript_39703/g.91990  ORF Transcript_39703/g.91990 Transcript_39703/m.91990 type:complete len:356 (-) Transcript_39703:82-1149(-)